MYRDMIEKLAAWKEQADHQPALITGAKAVGKTTVVREFAKKYYTKVVLFDLKDRKDTFVFQGELTRKRFDSTAAGYLQDGDKKEDVLVVFDHLDEELLGTHSAKDLLRFIVYNLMDYNICIITSLNVQKIFTEGILKKIDLFEMYPVSLKEFMMINQDDTVIQAIENSAQEDIAPEIMEKIKLYMKVYFITGGMPKVVHTYMETRSLEKVAEALKQTYEENLAYIATVPDEKLRKKITQVYKSVCGQLERPDKQFKYHSVSVFATKKGYEQAVNWLTDRGLLIRLNQMNMPQDKSFILYPNDIGILSLSLGIQFSQLAMTEDIYELKNRAMAQQFVLQQLLSEGKKPQGFRRKEGTNAFELICNMQEEPVALRLFWDSSTAPSSVCIVITKETTKINQEKMMISAFAVWNL